MTMGNRMKITTIHREASVNVGIEGAVMTLSPLPFLLVFAGEGSTPPVWCLVSAAVAAISCFLCALTLFRRPTRGRLFGVLSALAMYLAKLPLIIGNPFVALVGSIALIFTGFVLLDFRPEQSSYKRIGSTERRLERARWSILSVPLCVAVALLSTTPDPLFAPLFILLCSLISQISIALWAIKQDNRWYILLPTAGIAAFAATLYASTPRHVATVALLLVAVSFAVLPRSTLPLKKHEPWWQILLNHPARILLSTFFVLCCAGTLLLILPAASNSGVISVVDAAFTAVSAVCVTGLIVLDTPNDFSIVGQGIILLLIQLGGLGIMGVTTVALHALGRRISLRQERLMAAMTDTNHQDLIAALLVVLKLTFLAEGIGAVILSGLFYASGDPFALALWRGVFTAISAFCNAGFALQTDSLLPYQNQAGILHTVALLIVMGGMAPATCLFIPRWLRGKKIPIATRIALVTTAALLLAGTIFFLSLEWNGVLQGLSIGDKIQNAWFQSVTLRTAGFNSVDISQIADPTLLIMVLFMFIGGNPGGTAGGVKTTTVAIVAMAFWTNIIRRDDILIQSKRIDKQTVYRAVTIIMSGVILLILVILMLEITQPIPSRDLIFEATSAIGTVGLSTGATSLLDGIGKIIIIITMFAGRIGPMTLFVLLSSDDRPTSVGRYPEVEISLT
jgi:trk system potassium uptake protein TrkH